MKRLAQLVLSALLVAACDDKTTHNTNPAGAGSSTGAADAGGASSNAGETNGTGETSSGGSASTAGAPSNPANATDLDSFLVEEGRGFCARLFRCFEAGTDDFMAERLTFETPERCERLLAQLNATGAGIRDLRARIAEGNIHYVPEQAQKCLASLAECNGANSLDKGPCREAFDGEAKTGEACQRSADCAGDAYCDTFDVCPGTCVPRKAEGETCSISRECAYTEGAAGCERMTH